MREAADINGLKAGHAVMALFDDRSAQRRIGR
jgi:hypothetical protein